MIIVREQENDDKIEFFTLPISSTFLYDNEVYMKVFGVTTGMNVVNLSTGNLEQFSDNIKVREVSSELQIKKVPKEERDDIRKKEDGVKKLERIENNLRYFIENKEQVNEFFKKYVENMDTFLEKFWESE